MTHVKVIVNIRQHGKYWIAYFSKVIDSRHMLLWTRQNTRHCRWCIDVYDMFTINFLPRIDIVLMLFIIANTMTVQHFKFFVCLTRLFLNAELLDIIHVDHSGSVSCPGMGNVPHQDPGGPWSSNTLSRVYLDTQRSDTDVSSLPPHTLIC